MKTNNIPILMDLGLADPNQPTIPADQAFDRLGKKYAALVDAEKMMDEITVDKLNQ